MEPSEKQIFIVGTQRSGTTLLRLLLNAHSQIGIPEDASFLMPLLKKRYIHKDIAGDNLKALVDYFSLNSWFRLWNYDCSDFLSRLSKTNKISLHDLIERLYFSYCDKGGKKIWGDKTPSFFRKIDILFRLFPDAKFIHIVRDGRDAFDSFRKVDQTKNNSAVMAIDWDYKLFRIEKSFKKLPIDNRVTVRYEDLLEDTEKALRTICSVIGVDYEINMVNFYKAADNYIGAHHSKLIFSPVNKNNRYKWKKNLSLKELKVFNVLAGYYLKKYNYEVGVERVNLFDIMYLIKSLLLGLPRRITEIARMKKTLEKAAKEGQSIDYNGPHNLNW